MSRELSIPQLNLDILIALRHLKENVDNEEVGKGEIVSVERRGGSSNDKIL